MLFKRRVPLNQMQRLQSFFWPKSGFKRAFNYLMQRLARMPGSDYSLAAGFTAGAIVSFTPFVGFHFVLAAFLAVALRGNVLISAVGTLVGNPWTFPFLWLAAVKTGQWVLAIFGYHDYGAGLTIADALGNADQLVTLFVPWVIGASLLSIILGPWVLGISWLGIRSFRRHRRAKKMAKMMAMQAQNQAQHQAGIDEKIRGGDDA